VREGVAVIVAAHVASGAVIGALTRSHRTAVALALASHALADRVPHHDIGWRRFEIASGVGGVLLLAAADGPLARTTLGAIAAAAPDLEHVLPLPRPGGRKLFPSHRLAGWHRSGGVSAQVQLLAAGIALGWLAGARSAQR
jgi:hypothetical protein